MVVIDSLTPADEVNFTPLAIIRIVVNSEQKHRPIISTDKMKSCISRAIRYNVACQPHSSPLPLSS